MNLSKYLGPFLLVVMTFIWGTAFLAQKSGADVIGPFALTGYRNWLGGFFLLGCIGVRNWWRRRRVTSASAGSSVPRSRSILAGIVCGVPLFAAMITQQVGIEHTTPGISAFLTTNYVLFVPFIVAALDRRLPSLKTVVCVVAALIGTYCICLGAKGESGAFSLGRGEAWTILCALLFSIQVVAVDRVAAKCDLLVMSVAQLLTGAVLALPFLALPSERALLDHGLPVAAAWWPLVYCGVFSSGIAYTLQNFGQARTPAAVAVVIMSMEAVFGALAGYVVRGDVMLPMQLTGCGLVLAAVLFSQLFHHK